MRNLWHWFEHWLLGCDGGVHCGYCGKFNHNSY